MHPLREKYSKYSDHDLYLESRRWLMNELIGHVSETRLNILYDECEKRDIRIWNYAFDDACVLHASLEEAVLELSGRRIMDIRRIDFMNTLQIIDNIVGDDFDIVYIKGKSMEPTLKAGEHAVYTKTDKAKDGEIVVVSVEKKLLVKRLYFVDGGYMLHSDNKSYEPMFVPYEADIVLYGTIVEARRRVK